MAVGSVRAAGTRVSALVALLGGLFAAVLVAAPTAAAHTELTASDPAQGASLAVAPTAVTLTFSEAVTLPPNSVTVQGPAGAVWALGAPSVAGQVITVPVTESLGPAGAYLLSWSVVAADGDPVSGTVNFALTAAVPAPAPTGTAPTGTVSTSTGSATSAETPTAAVTQPAQAGGTPSDGDVPTWVWIVISVVLVAAVGGIVSVRRRSPQS